MKWKCRVSKHSERVTRAAWCLLHSNWTRRGGNIRHSPLKFKQQHQRLFLFLVPVSGWRLRATITIARRRRLRRRWQTLWISCRRRLSLRRRLIWKMRPPRTFNLQKRCMNLKWVKRIPSFVYPSIFLSILSYSILSITVELTSSHSLYFIYCYYAYAHCTSCTVHIHIDEHLRCRTTRRPRHHPFTHRIR